MAGSIIVPGTGLSYNPGTGTYTSSGGSTTSSGGTSGVTSGGGGSTATTTPSPTPPPEDKPPEDLKTVKTPEGTKFITGVPIVPPEQKAAQDAAIQKALRGENLTINELALIGYNATQRLPIEHAGGKYAYTWYEGGKQYTAATAPSGEGYESKTTLSPGVSGGLQTVTITQVPTLEKGKTLKYLVGTPAPDTQDYTGYKTIKPATDSGTFSATTPEQVLQYYGGWEKWAGGDIVGTAQRAGQLAFIKSAYGIIDIQKGVSSLGEWANIDLLKQNRTALDIQGKQLYRKEAEVAYAQGVSAELKSERESILRMSPYQGKDIGYGIVVPNYMYEVGEHLTTPYGVAAASVAGAYLAPSVLPPLLAKVPPLTIPTGAAVDLTKQFVLGGGISVGIGELSRTYSDPGYMPFTASSKTYATEFIAGGVVGVAQYLVYPALAAKVALIGQRSGAVYEVTKHAGDAITPLAKILNEGDVLARRLFVGGAAGAISLGTYPTSTRAVGEVSNLLSASPEARPFGYLYPAIFKGREYSQNITGEILGATKTYPEAYPFGRIPYLSSRGKEYLPAVDDKWLQETIQYAELGAVMGVGFEAASYGLSKLPLGGISAGKVDYKIITPEGIPEQHFYLGIGYYRPGQPVGKYMLGVTDFRPTLGQPNIYKGGILVPQTQPLTPLQAGVLEKPYEKYLIAMRDIQTATPELFNKKYVPQLDKALKEYLTTGGATAEQIEQGAIVEYFKPGGKYDFNILLERYTGGLKALRGVYSAPEIRELKLSEADVIAQYGYLKDKPDAIKAINDYIYARRTTTVTMGSTAKKTYMGEEMGGWAADADKVVYSMRPEAYAKGFYEAGKPYTKLRISPERESLVEAYTKGEWVHAGDIHSKYYSGEAEVTLSNWIGYGLPEKPYFIRADLGIQVSFGEEAARAWAPPSTLTQYPFGTAPPPYRFKDVIRALEQTRFSAISSGDKVLFAQYEALRGTIPEATVTAIAKEGSPLLRYVKPPPEPSYTIPVISSAPTPAYSIPAAKAPSYTPAYTTPKAAPAYTAPSYPSTPKYTPSYSYTPSYTYAPKYDYGYKYSPGYTYTPSYSYTPGYSYTPPYTYTPSYTYAPKYDYGYDYKYGYDYGYKYKYDYKYDYGYNYKYGYGYGYGYNYEYPPPPKKPPIKLLPSMPGFIPERPRRKLPKAASYQVSGARNIYSDLISVMASEVKYGKATHPSLVRRPQLWAGEATGRVPTVEILKGQAVKKTNTFIRSLGKKRNRR